MCLLRDISEELYIAGETVAEGDSLSGHWWIMLLVALVFMLAVVVIVFIICFFTRTRRQKRLHLSAGNILVCLVTKIVITVNAPSVFFWMNL